MTVLLVSAQFIANAQPAQQETATYETFYDALMPYGTWIDYPEYGYVWHPDVEDFRPYATNGYWEYTDGGWYWESEYDWGWATFHYGDWFYDDAYGWLWNPGYEWSPAHVDWGVEDDYYAWAAKSPEGWAHHDHEWNMVDRKHFYDRDLFASLVTRDHMRTDAARIRLVHSGPDVKDIENRSGIDIKTKSMHDMDKRPMKDKRMMDKSAMDDKMDKTMTGDYRMDNVVHVYRPKLGGNVQEMRYRKATSDKIRPVRKGDSWPSGNYRQHRQNIENLPMHTGSFQDCGKKGSYR